MCISHDGRTIAAADTQSTLSFWPLFDESLDVDDDAADDDDIPVVHSIVGEPICSNVAKHVSEAHSTSAASNLVARTRLSRRVRRTVSKHTIR